MTFLLVGIGGFLGSVARYGVYQGFVVYLGLSGLWATLTVNVLGGFGAGVCSQLFNIQALSSPQLLILKVGFLGAFTTFSAFSSESFDLIQRGAWSQLTIHSLLHLSVCTLAVGLGVASVGESIR